MNQFFKIIFITFVITQFTQPVQSKYGRYNVENEKQRSIEKNTSKAFGISAWGLVFLIVAFILLGVGAYYVAIFYPILCKKERKYDRIELATI